MRSRKYAEKCLFFPWWASQGRRRREVFTEGQEVFKIHVYVNQRCLILKLCSKKLTKTLVNMVEIKVTLIACKKTSVIEII